MQQFGNLASYVAHRSLSLMPKLNLTLFHYSLIIIQSIALLNENIIVYLTVFMSIYLHLNKYFESNQLYYIILASYPSPVDLFPKSLCLVP